MKTVKSTDPITGKPISLRIRTLEEAEAEKQLQHADTGFPFGPARVIRSTRINRLSGLREGNQHPGRRAMHKALMTWEAQKKGAA